VAGFYRQILINAKTAASEWARGMIKQFAVSNQRIVDLIASNTRHLDENTELSS
jgi:hypothetical protein